MSNLIRKIGFETAYLDPQVLSEDEDSLVLPSTIARELVQVYSDGRAYKPETELESAVQTAMRAFNGYLPVIYGGHPDFSNGYRGLLVNCEDVKGRTENLRFVKDLKDPKTGRPMDRGIKADIRFFKKELTPTQLDELRSGKRRDVSIGFVYDEDRTPGTWRDQAYDFVQRNMFLQHIAAGVPVGRCPSPYCGIGIDEVKEVTTMSKKKTTGLDPYASIEDLPDAVKVLPKEAQDLFLKVVNAALEQYDGDEEKAFATAWAAIKDKWEKNEDGTWVRKATEDCPVCDEITRLGPKRFAAKLARVLGVDAVKQLLDAETKEEFLEQCVGEGKSESECEELWQRQHEAQADAIIIPPGELRHLDQVARLKQLCAEITSR